MERLSQSLALQAFHELREFVVWQVPSFSSKKNNKQRIKELTSEHMRAVLFAKV